MKALQLQIDLPARTFHASKIRAIVASALDGKATPLLFHRNQYGNPILDRYPEVIFQGFHNSRKRTGTARITALHGPCEQELLTNAPAIIQAFNDHFGSPCTFRMTTVYPHVREIDEMAKYRIYAPVITRKHIKDPNTLKQEEVESMLKAAFLRGIHRFAERANIPIGEPDFYCEVETKMVPVRIERKNHVFSYLYLKEAKFVTNLEIKGPVFIGGLITHGHGRIAPCL